MNEDAIRHVGIQSLIKGPRFVEKTLSIERYKTIASKIFSEEFKALNADPKPHALLLAWRITRMLAIDMSLISPEDSLRQGLNGHSWVMLDWCTQKPNEYLPATLHDRRCGLIPFGSNGAAFAEAAMMIVDRAGMRRGSKKHPLGAKIALRYWDLENVTNPELLSEIYPNKYEIMEFEEELLTSLTDAMLDKEQHQFQKFLLDYYGLTMREVSNLTLTVRNQLAKYADQDTYTAKGFCIARLERIARRASEAGDVRAELNAIKSIAVLHGIVVNSGGNTTNDDFIEAVRNVTRDAVETFPSENKLVTMEDD